jgi:hypothetical protein
VNQPGNPSPGFAILVLPGWDLHLQGGCVQDPDHNCLIGARIEIIGGPMSGRATLTDQAGDWAFKGVSGVLQVRVSKDGYITAVQDVPSLTAGQTEIGLCGPVLAPVGGSTSGAVGSVAQARGTAVRKTVRQPSEANLSC